MTTEKSKTGFQLSLTAQEAEKFLKHLKNEGLMQAGFVIHESNNLTVNVQEAPDRGADTSSSSK